MSLIGDGSQRYICAGTLLYEGGNSNALQMRALSIWQLRWGRQQRSASILPRMGIMRSVSMLGLSEILVFVPAELCNNGPLFHDRVFGWRYSAIHSATTTLSSQGKANPYHCMYIAILALNLLPIILVLRRCQVVLRKEKEL